MPGGVNWGYYCSFLEKCGVGGGIISWHRTGWGFLWRGHSVSSESLGTDPQRQEQEAGLDKALGKVCLEDVFVAGRWGKAEAQRGAESFPETYSRAEVQVWIPLQATWLPCHLILPLRSLGHAVEEGISSTRSLLTPAKLQRWPYWRTCHTQDTVSGNSACPVSICSAVVFQHAIKRAGVPQGHTANTR